MSGSCMNIVVKLSGSDRAVANELTGSGQQVLQGTNWQVQGYNGSNAAQPDQPWGSTVTFQRNAGVSWVLGLRHGVAMHPRGRHLREGMTLLPTWESRTEREQQPNYQRQRTLQQREEQLAASTLVTNGESRFQKVAEDWWSKRQHIRYNQRGKETTSCCQCKHYYYKYNHGDEAEKDGRREIEDADDKKCIVLPVQNASQRSSTTLLRTQGEMRTMVK